MLGLLVSEMNDLDQTGIVLEIFHNFVVDLVNGITKRKNFNRQIRRPLKNLRGGATQLLQSIRINK